MTQNRPPITVCIMGPTGSGKTDLAVELVERYPFEIISVDSALVYRYMDIGTAKPSQQILSKAPHRLINMIDPDEAYSAATFRQQAQEEIQQIRMTGKIPLLVGGTGLYYRALLQGLDELPAADQDIRRRLQEEAEECGWTALHQRLSRVDEQAAKRIHPNDPQRISRALEVYELTGKPMSSFFLKRAAKPEEQRIIKIILEPQQRNWLHQRLTTRFEQMLEDGLLEELIDLKKKFKLNAELPSMRMVGYRQVWQHLSGEYAYQTMKEKAVVATRQLAKRQLTWLRKEDTAKRILIDRSKPLDEVLQVIKGEELLLSS